MDITSISLFLSVLITTAPSPGTPSLTYLATCPIPYSQQIEVVTCKITITPAGSDKPVRHESFAYDTRKGNLPQLVAQYTKTLD